MRNERHLEIYSADLCSKERYGAKNVVKKLVKRLSDDTNNCNLLLGILLLDCVEIYFNSLSLSVQTKRQIHLFVIRLSMNDSISTTKPSRPTFEPIF